VRPSLQRPGQCEHLHAAASAFPYDSTLASRVRPPIMA
jgi:hypothetical protein